MAYTIKMISANSVDAAKVIQALKDRLEKSPFKATIKDISFDTFVLKPVRLRVKKAYCGNHPGECVLPRAKKMKATYLEWADWIKFHKIVNSVLDKFKCNADVWSNPADVSGKMWIRKGMKARVKWEWHEEFKDGRLIRVWNKGTSDQFDRDNSFYSKKGY